MFEVADSLPCADFEFLKPLKLSPQYAAIRKRVANPKPLDAWQANLIHYFVFQLKPAADAQADADAPFALFSMSFDYDGPAKALVITPDASGTYVQVENLLHPGVVQTVPLKEPN
jgi:hypothetical protein